MADRCLSPDEVNDLAEGRLGAEQARDAQEHLDTCAGCRRLVAAMVETRTEPTIPCRQEEAEPALPVGRGTTIGRFRVTSLLGAGAMGAVYAGHDPELDRRVAIKLLHDRSVADAPCHERRLLDEARSMARLVHPNVVRIYDVGFHGTRPFIAMELVEGRTLRRWLGEKSRATKEIVAAFRAAGRGLSAAHDAGLLHGDFKPDNVLVAFDGRVEVGDFGLARPLDNCIATPEERQIGGTPAYLAPEVMEGSHPSAASDQFAFCVSLWEGLYGRRPFEGRSSQDLLDQARSRQLLPGPSREVPARLRRALARGLDPEPSARHPSMAALLVALDDKPRRWSAVAALAIAAVAALSLGPLRNSIRCSGARAELSPTWSAARRSALASAFHAAKQDAAWAVIDRALSSFATAWIDVHTNSCRATRVVGDQSEEVLERRSRCLTNQREVVAALGDLWLKAPPELLAKAPLALASLPLPSICGGDGPLNAEKLAEPAPQQAEKVDAARRHLAGITARLAAGDQAGALSLARDTSRDAKALGYAPLEAEALLTLGRALQQHGDLDEAEHAYQDATMAAVAARHEQTVAETMVALAQFVGTARSRIDDGEVLLSRAAPVVARLGDRKLASDLEILHGSLRLDRGDTAGAQTILAAQLPVLEALVGRDHPAVGELHHALFSVAYRQGKNDDARAQAEAELQVMERAMPPEHLKLYPALMDLATTETLLGNLGRAHHLLERAVRVAEKNQGPDGTAVAAGLANYGPVLTMEGDLCGAHAALERALRISMATRGPTHPLSAHLELTLGEMDWKAGSTSDALGHLTRAAERREQRNGRRHADTAEVLAILGRAQLDAGQADGLALVLEADALVRELTPNARRRVHTAGHACEVLLEAERPGDAEPYCQRMLDAAREEWKPDQPSAIEALAMMTSLDLAQKRDPRARRVELEAGLAAMEKRNGAYPRATIAVRRALAQVLSREPDAASRSRAHDLARAALDSAHRLGARRRQVALLEEIASHDNRTAAN
jgi:serine/threonine protein kinase